MGLASKARDDLSSDFCSATLALSSKQVTPFPFCKHRRFWLLMSLNLFGRFQLNISQGFLY